MVAPEIPEVSSLRFILEVTADSEADVGDKLYGYDDIEAESVARGYGPRELTLEEMEQMDSIAAEEWEQIQREQETVNELLTDAIFNGHPVLFKTDGTNLSGDDGPIEIPHFGHGASNCEKPYSACEDEEGAGGVYRLFSPAELVVAGEVDSGIFGTYELRDDVHVRITGYKSRVQPGETPAKKVEPVSHKQ